MRGGTPKTDKTAQLSQLPAVKNAWVNNSGWRLKNDREGTKLAFFGNEFHSYSRKLGKLVSSVGVKDMAPLSVQK